MTTRRDFIKKSVLAGAGAALLSAKTEKIVSDPSSPVVISTWDFGKAANAVAMDLLNKGGTALDAVEKGVRVPEADPEVDSVGYGGLPDRDGHVTLDSCIMDHQGRCGSVAFLEHIKHPISVARLVMDKTPHVMLVGEGALKFALDQGFKKEKLLTPKAEKAWKEWLKEKKYKPVINFENHDTIGMLALDTHGNLSGACTTSGLAFKMHGRIGDSPIIGAALFVDNEVGCATATGHGEYVIKNVGAYMIVEYMRQGKTPQEACQLAIERIVKKTPNFKDIQVGFLAMNTAGETGAYSIHPGFTYAIAKGPDNSVVKADHFVH